MKNFKDFCNEEQWSGDVKTKKHPKEDLFAEGTAKQIADWAIKSHKDLRGAMAALNFYINRAGDKLEADRKKVIEDAKDLVHKHYGVNESRNLVDIEADIKYLLAHPEKDDYKLVKLEKEYKKAGGEKSLGVLSKEIKNKVKMQNESSAEAKTFEREFTTCLDNAITICKKYKKLDDADSASFQNLINTIESIIESDDFMDAVKSLED